MAGVPSFPLTNGGGDRRRPLQPQRPAATGRCTKGVDQMSSPSIPAPATEPDPSSNSDWDPSPGESISGVVHDREEIETKYGPRVVLSISTGDGEVTRVPCFRMHLRE